MKRALVLPIAAVLGALAFAPPTFADWSFRVGVDFGGAYGRSGRSHGGRRWAPPPARHVHVRVPIYREVWVPPAYGTVIAGYDRHRRPVYRTVILRHGYTQRVLVGYRCQGCGSACP